MFKLTYSNYISKNLPWDIKLAEKHMYKGEKNISGLKK